MRFFRQKPHPALLNELPEDLVIQVMQQLDLKSLVALTRINRRLQEVANLTYVPLLQDLSNLYACAIKVSMTESDLESIQRGLEKLATVPPAQLLQLTKYQDIKLLRFMNTYFSPYQKVSNDEMDSRLIIRNRIQDPVRTPMLALLTYRALYLSQLKYHLRKQYLQEFAYSGISTRQLVTSVALHPTVTFFGLFVVLIASVISLSCAKFAQGTFLASLPQTIVIYVIPYNYLMRDDLSIVQYFLTLFAMVTVGILAAFGSILLEVFPDVSVMSVLADLSSLRPIYQLSCMLSLTMLVCIARELILPTYQNLRIMHAQVEDLCDRTAFRLNQEQLSFCQYPLVREEFMHAARDAVLILNGGQYTTVALRRALQHLVPPAPPQPDQSPRFFQRYQAALQQTEAWLSQSQYSAWKF